MSNLPTGTVTFLFTDIEGSTKLARAYPEDWETAHGRHDAILRGAIESNNGYVFKIVGDAFCAAFHIAGDALKAALTGQHNLQREPWGDAVIRVRMGIHTGEAETEGNDYRGHIALSLVQRVMSAGHGGQILLSGVTEHLLRDQLPKDVTLCDLGEHRLKDATLPVRIFQVLAPDLPNDFPALRALEVLPNNLPTQLTSFIGREKEIGQIKKRLEKNRLVTLTGSGGVGKTRLLIQVASELLNEYPNGVWLVELAPLTDPALVTQAVCTVLDVTPQGNAPALNVLADYLHSKRILLVVDNCEHLIDACAQLCDSLLHACHDLHIIASSREALGIEGENAYRVPSLSLPDSHSGLHTIEESEAVKLFMERATALLPDFELTEPNAPVIAQICQRLDGIALAIELAAARVRILKVEQIASRLDDAFRLLTGGSRTALPRQQTLRALIDWSYNLLSDEERVVFRQLSVFMGGWTLEAAEAVCDNVDILDLLTHLVDKSLVAIDREHGEEVRYYLLETIRQYAREKLIESREGERVRARHLDYFLKLAQKAEPELYGAGQIEWGQKLEDEYENMRTAMEWSLQADATAGQQLAATLWWSWSLSGRLSEGYEWLKRMLTVNPEHQTIIRARLLSGAGWFAALLDDRGISKTHLEESVWLFHKLGDEAGAAYPLSILGTNSFADLDYELTLKLVNESLTLFENAGNKWGIRHAVGILGYTAQAQGNFAQAQEYYEKSLLICKEIGDKEGIGWTLYLMGGLAEELGDDVRIMELYEEALQIERTVKSKPLTSWILMDMGHLLIRQGDYERASLFLNETIELCSKMGDQSGEATSIRILGWSARLQGDYLKARSLYLESLQLSHRIDNKDGIARCLIHVGELLLVQGSPEKFVLMFGQAEGIVPNILRISASYFRTDTEQFIETARAALGNEAYTAAYAAGHEMPLDEAVAYALKALQ